MGGRGASSGTSIKGKKYGSQFHAVKDSKGKPLVRRGTQNYRNASREN